jgi:toluene monooxygenase system protein D
VNNVVGPVLRMGHEVEHVLAAIEQDNPGRVITVVDRGAYVRIEGEDRIILTQDTLRRYLGADYEIRSFGAIMSSFRGRVVTTSQSITWQSASPEARATGGTTT